MPTTPEDSEYIISAAFQKRLLELIEEHDCNKAEFSSFTGVSQGMIGRATKYGIIPSVRSLIKIANSCNISIKFLLGESDKDDFYMSDHPTNFQFRLKQLSEEKNLSYSKIAHEMPFPRSYFFDWMREDTLPSLDYLFPLAEYFDVSIDYLLGRTDQRHN